MRRSYRSAAATSSPSSLRDLNSDAVVHPPTSIEYELYRRSLMAAKACWLRHHHGGASHAAPAHPVDAPGAAPTHRHIPHAQAQTDRAERGCCRRSTSGAAFQPPHDACQVARLGSSLLQSRSFDRAHAVRRGAAPVLWSAAHEVRTDVQLVPAYCGVAVELDRLSTGLRQL